MKKTLLILAAALLMLSGCVRDASPLPSAPSESGRLVVYTSHKEEVWRPLIREFEERTGIWVEVETGGTNEMLEKLSAESGSPRADIMFGGGVESLSSCRDCFEPYIPGEADMIIPGCGSPDGIWTPFSRLPLVIIYNTKLVPDLWLDDWASLKSPRLQGRIAFADPEVSGSSYTGLLTLAGTGPGFREKLEEFASALGRRQLAGSGDVLDSVAGGTDLVGITLEETARKRMLAGDPVAMVYPSSGTSIVPDGTALVKGAPHADNARKFIDFTISEEVQNLLARKFSRRPVRAGAAEPSGLPPLSRITIAGYDIEWAAANRETVLKAWTECMEAEKK